MSSSNFAQKAATVKRGLTVSTSIFAREAAAVKRSLSKVAMVDRNADWQRVNSSIADSLKDIHVLYSKLARLQGDFAGSELERIEKLSEQILAIGGEMSGFSKEFTAGKLQMTETPQYGGQQQGQPQPQQGQPQQGQPQPQPQQAPAPEMPVTMDDEELDSYDEEFEGEGEESGKKKSDKEESDEEESED
jgi:hypothetical protein